MKRRPSNRRISDKSTRSPLSNGAAGLRSGNASAKNRSQGSEDDLGVLRALNELNELLGRKASPLKLSQDVGVQSAMNGT